MRELNESQQRFVQSDSSKIVCLAGAGTGKTLAVISKICDLILNKGTMPSSILALTFTNAAAEEMEQRYKRVSSISLQPEFRTFHSFCYKILCEDESIRQYFGYKNVPEILSEAEELSLFSRVMQETKVKLPKSHLQSYYTPDIKEKFEYTIFHKHLNKLLVKYNKITFDRLCYGVCFLFKTQNSIVQKYLDQYKYVIVDEFQDTDLAQWRFVESFLPKAQVVVVGDIRQNIYSFRGTTNQILKALSKDDSWDKIVFDENYRSTIEICEYVNNFTNSYNDKEESIELKSNKEGANVAMFSWGSLKSAFIENSIQINPDTAFLCRTNKEVEIVKQVFRTLNILHKEIVSDDSSDVYVGTIHSVKGLEFDSVYVLGVNSKYFKIEESEESQNIFYVACTRAKNYLAIVYDEVS